VKQDLTREDEDKSRNLIVGAAASVRFGASSQPTQFTSQYSYLLFQSSAPARPDH